MTNIPAIPPLLIERTGSLGWIKLNRPKALNSLTLDMVRQISAALEMFEHDSAISAVMISGEGDRAFCAGGDIRAIYEAGRAGDPMPLTFWREEYRLNARIAEYPKPYIAVMDGIVMGGGVGIAVHASHRIVTERTAFAMPEAGIGLVPDVGGSWFLPRAPGEFGTYLGLTGIQIGAAAAIFAGVADAFVLVAQIENLIEQLAALPPGANKDAVSHVISRVQHSAPSAPQLEHRLEIDSSFAHGTVQQIIAALDRLGTPFALETLQALATKSPTSLILTLQLLRLGRTSTSLKPCLEREFRVCNGIFHGRDFYEGVRAAVIDKDRNPQWLPDRLDLVDPNHIESIFATPVEPVFQA
jgi:enoyl-CoA hydratase